MDDYSKEKEDFAGWCDMWEKAEKDMPPSYRPHPAAEMAGGWLGPQTADQDVDIRDVEAKYWSEVMYLTESRHGDFGVLSESPLSKGELGSGAKAIAQTPNPIRQASIGPDQDSTPRSLGMTFTPADLEVLSDMKVRLHDLESKLSATLGRGEAGTQFEAKITAMRRKINELSDMLTQGADVLPQGD